ncbi:hypothetical protein ISN45_Aa05g012460 [Arabidopsis thaliana x Arabidopsis arenosa]|uniref:Uncharacterized protein n=1 Tax=Arabidopsis thaliana x Arabidopsis arenosa TaxID=1240361 RepID=A0A8T1ZLS5_9BRAS|nr:hypothetical protein ISN45_Aa05g012460 [Arabidopsis thaliana x Arabidopsis arenosa]
MVDHEKNNTGGCDIRASKIGELRYHLGREPEGFEEDESSTPVQALVKSVHPLPLIQDEEVCDDFYEIPSQHTLNELALPPPFLVPDSWRLVSADVGATSSNVESASNVSVLSLLVCDLVIRVCGVECSLKSWKYLGFSFNLKSIVVAEEGNGRFASFWIREKGSRVIGCGSRVQKQGDGLKARSCKGRGHP